MPRINTDCHSILGYPSQLGNEFLVKTFVLFSMLKNHSFNCFCLGQTTLDHWPFFGGQFEICVPS